MEHEDAQKHSQEGPADRQRGNSGKVSLPQKAVGMLPAVQKAQAQQGDQAAAQIDVAVIPGDEISLLRLLFHGSTSFGCSD